jgi:flagellar capping protein FliD
MRKERNCGMPYPMYQNGMMPIPMAPTMNYQNNIIQDQINSMQNQISNLENKVTKLETNMKAETNNYNTKYNDSNYYML